MDELEISGKRYISTRRAAKEHKYHADYIGQLIRAGKVGGQKVGRSWYVVADSLSTYLGKETPPREAIFVDEAVEEEKPAPVVEVEVAETKSQKPEPVEEPILVETAVVETEPEQVKEIAEIKKTVPEKDEHYIPIKIERPTPQPRVAPKIYTHAHTNTLRYMSDDEPLFPAIKRESAPARAVERHVEQEEQPVVVIPRPQQKKNRYIQLTVVRAAGALAVGVAVFGIVALLGRYLISTTTVVEGQPASVTYGFK